MTQTETISIYRPVQVYIDITDMYNMNLKGLIILDTLGNRYILVPEKVRPIDNHATSLPSITNIKTQLEEEDLMASNEEFRVKLRTLRADAKISQSSLAKAAGTKQPNIAAIESGKRAARPETQKSLIKAWKLLSQKSWK